MKKTISLILACILLLGAMFTFASCSKVTKDYAEKINTAAENGEHFTVSQVKEDLGDEALDYTFNVLGSINGAIVAVKGCKTKDEIEEKIDSGEKIEGLVVVILGGKAISAKYSEITEDDIN